MSPVIRRAGSEEFATVLEFLRQNGYPLEVNPADAFYVAIERGGIIGVVRLARECGFTVLRGMRVAPEAQRRGVGTQLLHMLAKDLADTDCYCLPYAHLVDFYGQIGFEVLDPDRAPAHLVERIADYRAAANGKQYTLMYRPRPVDVPSQA